MTVPAVRRHRTKAYANPIAVIGVANAFQHWTTCSHIDKSVRIRRMKLIRRGIRQRTVSMSMSIVIVIAVEGNQYVAGDWRAAGQPGGRALRKYMHICIDGVGVGRITEDYIIV